MWGVCESGRSAKHSRCKAHQLIEVNVEHVPDVKGQIFGDVVHVLTHASSDASLLLRELVQGFE